MRLLRVLRIVHAIGSHGLDEFLPRGRSTVLLRAYIALAYPGRRRGRPRGERLRRALESLGPVFVKFGQLLSVRRDLIPPDIADELAKLQDEVPPFPWEQVREAVERSFGRPIGEVYGVFESQPIASASVAQVHFATLPDGREVACKIIRPGIAPVIGEDVALLATLAGWIERTPDGARLRPREVVEEFDKTIHDELDLVREAASASQLRRNFEGSTLLIVPEVYWDWCNASVMTMERIHGIPVNARARLEAAGIDIRKLARDGVEIFFTQVFRHGFFHADMHPGNIFVASDGRYVGIDFGIMGTLSDRDKRYLAANFMAFFHRDYRRVAIAHIEAGWVPADTRVDEFEGAIRSVCEPIFDRPLKEIYFGKLLIRLFEVSRRFRMQIQPQLVLLQKTLLQVEGLGRQLDPDLDLRRAAQPILERWMNEQVGVRGFMHSLRDEAPMWARTIPQLPRLLHQVLANTSTHGVERQLARLEAAQRRQSRVLMALVVLIAVLGAFSLLR